MSISAYKRSKNFGFYAVLLCLLFAFSLTSCFFCLESKSADATQPSSDEVSTNLGGLRLKTLDELRLQLENGGIVEIAENTSVGSEIDSANASSLEAASDSSLPDKVDLRERGVVTSVKDQSPFNTCWAFATNAAIETSIASGISNLDGVSSYDLSSHQTGWFGYTPLSTDKSKLRGTELSQAGEGSLINDSVSTIPLMDLGGTDTQAADMFMSGIGVAKNEDIPYSSSTGTHGLTANWALTDQQRNFSLTRLKKQNVLGSTNYFAYDGSWFSNDTTVVDAIKKELSEGRGVEISYNADVSSPGDSGNSKYMNYSNWAQYNYGVYYSEIYANHSVCIVGYDDTYSRQNFNASNLPPKDGAFIVKNSWGGKDSSGWDYANDWGVDGSGYFYLSYYDHSIKRAMSFEVDTDFYSDSYIDTDNEIIDQYDYMQANGVSYFSQSCDTKPWYANVFTASENQNITSIGTYYITSGSVMDYRVYKLKEDATSPSDYLSETPDATGSFVSDYEGFTRIDLDNSVYVEAGQKYAVWFSQVSRGTSYCPIGYTAGKNYQGSGIEFYGNAVVNEGESFRLTSYSKGWVDWYESWKLASSDDSLVYDNYCVKAYASVDREGTSKVTFDRSGLGISPATQYVKTGLLAMKPADPMSRGYTFDGWYKEDELVNKFNFAYDAIEGDTVLYAKWTPIRYKITYTLNGGDNSTNNPDRYTYSYGVESFEDPTKVGFDFLGWYLDADCTVPITEISNKTLGDVQLYAKWAIRDTVVEVASISGNGSVTIDGVSVSAGSKLAVVAGNDMTITWKGKVSDTTNFSLLKSLKMNNEEFDPISSIDKTKWQEENSEYKRRMKQTRDMTTFDLASTSVQSLTIPASKIKLSDDDITVKKLYFTFEDVVPVYRLYNMTTSEHLFTTDKTEYDTWEAACRLGIDSWIGEGIDWLSPKTSSSSTKQVYRLYNAKLGAQGKSSHYYTADASEMKKLTKSYGWVQEKQFSGGYVFLSDERSGSTPIYTCYNEALGAAHHYTSDREEWLSLRAYGWDLEPAKNTGRGVFRAVTSAKA